MSIFNRLVDDQLESYSDGEAVDGDVNTVQDDRIRIFDAGDKDFNITVSGEIAHLQDRKHSKGVNAW